MKAVETGFKVKYKAITVPHFVEAMHFLTTQTVPTKVAYNIKKIADSLESARKKIGAEYHKDIVEAYSKKNEDGTIAHPKDPDGKLLTDQFEPDETRKDEMKKAVDAFGEREITVDRFPLYIEELNTTDIKMSASHLSALDPILATLEEAVEQVG